MLKKLALAGMLALAGTVAVNAAQHFAPTFSNVQTATASASALPNYTMANGVIFKADIVNTGVIYIGPCSTLTAGNGYPLKAGEAISYGITYMPDICMIGTNTTDVLHFTGN